MGNKSKEISKIINIAFGKSLYPTWAHVFTR